MIPIDIWQMALIIEDVVVDETPFFLNTTDLYKHMDKNPIDHMGWKDWELVKKTLLKKE